MTTKNIAVLAAVAAALGAAAYFTGGAKSRQPVLNGRRLLPEFSLADVESVEIGGKVKLAAGADGWVVESMQGYPADRDKLVENLEKLRGLKVGQIARGRSLGAKTEVVVKGAAGKTIASVALGDRHEKWGHGRYAEFEGQTVLVADTLDAFGDDPKRWCTTKVIDSPYIVFKELAAPSLSEEELGFATGVVAKVTIAGDTNRVATVGAAVKDGEDHYLKIDGEKWVYVISKHSAKSLTDKVEEERKKAEEALKKADEEPAKGEDAKDGESKAEDAKADESAKAEEAVVKAPAEPEKKPARPKAVIESNVVELPSAVPAPKPEPEPEADKPAAD